MLGIAKTAYIRHKKTQSHRTETIKRDIHVYSHRTCSISHKPQRKTRCLEEKERATRIAPPAPEERAKEGMSRMTAHTDELVSERCVDGPWSPEGHLGKRPAAPERGSEVVWSAWRRRFCRWCRWRWWDRAGRGNADLPPSQTLHLLSTNAHLPESQTERRERSEVMNQWFYSEVSLTVY